MVTLKNLFKKKICIFYQYFQLIIENIVEATDAFVNQMNNLDNPDLSEDYFGQIKLYEQKGDKYTHQIIVELNKAFITPLENEDIMDLALQLDDVLNCLMGNASHILMYDTKAMDKTMELFIQNIQVCVKELSLAINLLTNQKLKDMSKHTNLINDLEDKANEILTDGLKNLFNNCTDPIELIKKKEIYSMMESFSDTVEDAANTLDGIIMRNS